MTRFSLDRRGMRRPAPPVGLTSAWQEKADIAVRELA